MLNQPPQKSPRCHRFPRDSAAAAAPTSRSPGSWRPTAAAHLAKTSRGSHGFLSLRYHVEPHGCMDGWVDGWMYAYVCVCMYTYVYVCICVCICVYVCVCVCMCMCMCVYVCVCMCMYVCMCVWMYACMHAWMDVCK